MFSALEFVFFLFFLLDIFVFVSSEASRVCRVQSRRSRPQLRLDFCTLYRRKKKNTNGEKKKKKKKKLLLDSFGGLVLDCITTVSGVQSVIAECSLYICVSLHPPREKPVE